MRVYVIHPGASFATADVYTGLVAGLGSFPGVEVYEGRIDTILTWYETALHDGTAAGHFDLSAAPGVFNLQRMASAHITQNILQVWPDLVLNVSGHSYHIEDVKALRRVGLKTACIFTESPYFQDLEFILASLYGAVFTNERRCVERYGEVARAFYLPHAYNPAVHTPDGPRATPCDAFFVGSWFEERRRLLMPLAESADLSFVWKGNDMTASPGALLPNTEVAAWYRSARISINTHRTTTSHGDGEHIKAGEAESLNPRAYEIAACGGFQLCDDSRAELFDLFGDWAPTYKAGDADDLVRQTRYWLGHDARREETAQAMHQAILPHTWEARARTVLEALV